MEERVKLDKKFVIACFILIALGAFALGYGFATEPDRAWANFLLNNYYFLSVAIGAAFFLALQYITRSGWSAGFKRVPEAMSNYVPVAAIFFILIYFGAKEIYHWAHGEAMQHDPVLMHKKPYLNLAFFYVRLVLYFGAWIGLIRLIRLSSLKEDVEGGTKYFHKSEWYSRVFIFVLAITFTLATIDWIMSIDTHWFSTVFALKNFVMAFYHGGSIIVLIVLLLHRQGHFAFLNEQHVLDFSRYIFMPAIIWGYLWFSQFMLIWYGNIPEETFYYVARWQPVWEPYFWLNIILNWAVPFVILMPQGMGKNKTVLTMVIILLIVGQWVDLFIQIFPGSVGKPHLGLVEILAFLGYVGLFALVTGKSLEKANLIPKNHPLLEESLQH